ncbi:SDR family oxidoreductase [Hymenobacter wooponensis]|uniref:SDR family NAD(P)-dependent oxidoreductase n=1 Tax=Hymenobacter wooponensis TaxID=1525360 RepID=A0A4Z0MMB7_9BACT|nr:SDR family NAD(P)-dependent oxidoreductase [Hymenobacter wooponensis]TGD80530.1 SDR family NAD(P)-dependent oxidoreductase [Hymenobacter wooponensis]
MHLINNRKALISGGGSGIGRAIAEKLSASIPLAVADLQPGNLPATVVAVPCDVTSGPEVDRLFDRVQAELGQIDILVCSAGRGIQEKLTEGDPEKWRQIIEINLLGALRLVRAFVPGMMAAGRGDVVFISSVAAGQAYAYGGVYAATKAALETVAETLRQETLPHVRVTVVAPGVTDTAFFQHTVSGFHTPASIGYGALSAEEVADAVLYALSQPPEVSLNHITIRPTAQPF